MQHDPVVGNVQAFVAWAKNNPELFPICPKEIREAEDSKGEGWGIVFLLKSLVLDTESKYWDEIKRNPYVARTAELYIRESFPNVLV